MVSKSLSVFLCGDVMTGRGIDQILPYPSNPVIYEPFITDAREYVSLAEMANGPVPRMVDFSYIWGDALEELKSRDPDFRVINLETSVTTSNDYWKGKGINYRMNPSNFPCILSLGIDCCVLANNHVMDWGRSGLLDTISVIDGSGLKFAGAGSNSSEAQRPAVMHKLGKGRLIVFSFCLMFSGVPPQWDASQNGPGVNLIDLSENTINKIANQVRGIKGSGDIVVGSIHWGDNWGYQIPSAHMEFAHMLIDKAGVDIIHGHSSHHVKGLEIYRGKLIMYGCGDFINDYEGISGYEEFRGDLSLMFFIEVNTETGCTGNCSMVLNKIKNMRLSRAPRADREFLCNVLNREGTDLGCRVKIEGDELRLVW